MDKGLTQNIPNALKIFGLNLSAQAQKFGIFEKKNLWMSVVRSRHGSIFDIDDSWHTVVIR